jgi:DNA-binding transcriptional MocR family regulator
VAHHRLNAGPVPLYHQLSQLLREEIEQGTYQPGDRLPSEPELIREYGVSRITSVRHWTRWRRMGWCCDDMFGSQKVFTPFQHSVRASRVDHVLAGEAHRTITAHSAVPLRS